MNTLLTILVALALQGTPYSKMNCWQFTNAASATTSCGAEALSTDCGGRFRRVLSNLSTLDLVIFERDLKPGDVAQFHGGHVAMYLGRGVWIDSSRKRNGVAKFSMLDELASNDRGWYGGPIQIMRRVSR